VFGGTLNIDQLTYLPATLPVAPLHVSYTCVCVSRYVIMELIDTERDYVRDLGLVVEVCNLFITMLL